MKEMELNNRNDCLIISNNNNLIDLGLGQSKAKLTRQVF